MKIVNKISARVIFNLMLNSSRMDHLFFLVCFFKETLDYWVWLRYLLIRKWDIKTTEKSTQKIIIYVKMTWEKKNQKCSLLRIHSRARVGNY